MEMMEVKSPFVFISTAAMTPKKFEKLKSGRTASELILEFEDEKKGLLLDTFENNLLQKGTLLIEEGENLILQDIMSGRTNEQSVGKKWRFASELGGGPVGTDLEKISRLRAFLPVSEISFQLISGKYLDDELKTTARFRLMVLHNGSHCLSLGRTEYLRGYDEEYDDLIIMLKKLGAKPLTDPMTTYRFLGVKNDAYSSKPVIALKKDAPSKQSAIQIISTFLSIARQNEKGIIDDLDTEFLHDYRVSLRKVRSVISLFKGVFALEETNSLKNEFANLMRPTNNLRDLDVYLLERDRYFSLVPETSHAGLNILFSHLEKRRGTALATVRKQMKSKAYGKQMEILVKHFSSEKNFTDGERASVLSGVFGSKLIFKRYRQVCRIAGTINDATPAHEVHQLRIACKKLRYLMEFFTPLYNENKIGTLIKSLKKLQDNLGNFNDCSVQQHFLRHIITGEIETFGREKIAVSEAIGALTAMLHSLQVNERKQVVSNFQNFDSEETKMLFTELFAVKDNV